MQHAPHREYRLLVSLFFSKKSINNLLMQILILFELREEGRMMPAIQLGLCGFESIVVVGERGQQHVRLADQAGERLFDLEAVFFKRKCCALTTPDCIPRLSVAQTYIGGTNRGQFLKCSVRKLDRRGGDIILQVLDGNGPRDRDDDFRALQQPGQRNLDG